MAYELDSEARERLRGLYSEMSDQELFALAGKPEDLTEIARELVRAEFANRRLNFPVDEPPSSAGHEYVPGYEVGRTLPDGSVALITFHDAIEAGEACDALEDASIEVDVRDVSEKSTASGSFYGGPAVALQLIVSKHDRERAMKVLREKMGLFPLQEVEESDPVVDDGTVSTLGDFGRREDAEAVAQVLDQAGIWHRVAATPGGSAATEDAYTVEVREIDLVKAGDVVERAMGLAEG